MTIWGKVTGARFAAFAILAATCTAMTACEGRGYGSPSEHPTAAPSDSAGALMGTPDGGPGGTRSPAYVSPPPEGPPPADASGGPPPYPPAPYAQGGSPPVRVIAMAPIPNPVERPRHHGRHRAGRGWWGPAHTAPMRHRHHRHGGDYAAAPIRHHAPAHMKPAHVAPVAAPPVPKALKPHVAKPQFAAPKPPAKTVAKAQAPTKAAEANHSDAATTAAAAGGHQASNTTASANTQSDQGAAYDSLQSALTDAFTRTAKLEVPAQMTTGQPADVTLTVPADFGQTLKTDASNNNLSNEAAAVNLSAILSGEGYTIVPAEALSQAITDGAPTVFHWKVTPQTEARNPLSAQGRALLTASGRSLAIGTVKPGSGTIGRVVGVGLLILIALILLGWAAQRRRPKPTGAVRPAPQSNYKPPV